MTKQLTEEGQQPCLSPSQGVDLSSADWRDANLKTLPEWHPAFYEVHPDLENLLTQFSGIMKRYKSILTETSDDPHDELQNHIEYEVSMWFNDRMDEIIRAIWKK